VSAHDAAQAIARLPQLPGAEILVRALHARAHRFSPRSIVGTHEASRVRARGAGWREAS
jgi:hypothetical protein